MSQTTRTPQRSDISKAPDQRNGTGLTAHLPRNLNSLQFRGLQKLGDAYVPGDEELPSFSACGCAEHADRILDHMPTQDLKDLRLLLGILGTLPRFVVGWIVGATEWGSSLPGPLGNFARFLRLGLKGLVVTLYYSGETGRHYTGRTSHQVLGYQVGVYVDDLRAQPRSERPESDLCR